MQYEKRADVLANIPSIQASNLTSSCETLYATFLSDIINNCRRRANECKNTEEMAMLKSLSDYVFAAFGSGDRIENIQCNMLRNAMVALDSIGGPKGANDGYSHSHSHSSHQGAGAGVDAYMTSSSMNSQRLQNPYRKVD